MAKRLACALTLAVLAVPAGGAEAAEWSRGRDVPGTSGLGFPFDADVGGRGRVAVAVVRDGVRVIVRAPGGRWGAAKRLSPARAGATAPQVEVTGRGEVIAAWTQSSSRRQPVSGPNAIRVAVRSRAGRWQSQTLGGSRHFIAAEPRLAVNARGDAAVIWRGWHRRGGRDRLLVAVRPAGGSFGRAASMGEAGIDQQVAVDRGGRVHAAWTRTLPPQHLRSRLRFATRAAGAWSRPLTVAEDRVGGPQLAAVPDGSVVMAWRAAERGLGATRAGEVMAAVRDRAGAWSPPQPLSASRTKEIHLGMSAAGEVLATWNLAQPSLPEREGFAVHQASRPAGGVFGPVALTPDLQDGPLAVLADGAAVTVVSQAGLVAAVRPPGGTFGPPERLSRIGDFPVVSAWGQVAAAVWMVFPPDRLRLATLRTP